MAMVSSSRFCRIRSFLITMIMLFSGGAVLLSLESNEALEGSRGDTMGEWEELPSEGWPPSITTGYCEIMYREDDRELVVFNRENSQEWEVWSYFEGNDTWFKWNTMGQAPDARYSNQAFTSNTDNDVAYFYGGYRQSSYNRDKLNIFFYSNKTWIEVDTPSSLGGRYWSEMVYDGSTDSIWIFGGRDNSRDFRDDIFRYNLTDGWNQPEPVTKPAGRDQASMSIVPNGSLIHVSLGRYYRSGWDTRYKHDLWEFNVSTETWTEISADLGIDTDAGAFMVYRSDTDDLMISNGFDGNSILNDTFIVEPSDGSVQQAYLKGGIPGRHMQAWDLSMDGSEIYVFGDESHTPDYWSIDLYTFDSMLMPGNPAWQGGDAFTGYDPEDGGKLMTLKRIGGTSWQLAYYSLSQERWISLDISNTGGPDHDDGMAFAYDHVNNDFYLYGGVIWIEVGQNDWIARHYDDFWKLDCDSGDWTRITENAQPGERGRATLSFDEERGHLYLFGGQIPLGDTSSIYRYNISSNSWKSYSFTIEPQPRREHSAVFDQEGDRIFIFGGRRNNSGSNPELNDLWTFDVIQEQWQKMPEGDEPPTLQTWAGLSYNSNTDELLLMGDAEDEMFLWRQEFLGWVREEAATRPVEWSGHGQAYSSRTGMHYAWAHTGQQVWEYTPILRTTAGEIKLLDPDGNPMTVLPGEVNRVFPSSGIYEVEVTGTTDMPSVDLLGFGINLSNSNDFMELNWTVSGGLENIRGNDSWIDVKGDIDLTWDAPRRWRFTLPFDVLFSAENGDTFDFRIYPMTEEARSERSQRLNIFRVLTDLSVSGYQASTPLQPVVVDGGWLFGKTDLTVSNFTVTFKDATSISPGGGTYRIWMTTSSGDRSYWDYVPDEEGSITVPINGQDGEMLSVWLNLTSLDGTILNSKEFNYMLDLDPPAAPSWARVRADSFTDETYGMDNDNTVFLTWGSIFENGSGLKGVCYSMDVNLWPQESNLTEDFSEITIIEEGRHTFYIWGVDNTSRAGDVITANVTIDTHMVDFSELTPDPDMVINLTQDRVTLRVTITDELSGVDPDSVEVQYSLPDRSLSDWEKVEVPRDDLNNLSFKYTHRLVPDIKNVIGFRATDLARNEIRTSTRYGINYFPGLATPQASLAGPEDGAEVINDVRISWDGGYINPLNLSFEVHVEDPLGGERIFRTVSDYLDFIPTYPGEYSWWVVSNADGMTNQTPVRSFSYKAPLITTSVMGAYEADQGDDIAITVSTENPLLVMLNITVSIDGDDGFTIKNGSSFDLSAGEKKDIILGMATSEADPGPYNVNLNFTDDYGRSRIQVVQIRINAVDMDGTEDEGEEEGSDMTLFIIIAVAAIVIIVALIAFLVIRRKPEEEEIEEEEVEKEPSLDYDPTGVVAEGGTGIDPGVNMTPGMLEQRESQSNVVEINIPEKEEGIPDGADETGSIEPPETEE